MKKSAFTILEIVIVIALLTIFLGGGLAYSLSGLTGGHFQTTVQEVKQALISAQTLSRYKFKNQKSGVAFNNDGFVEFTADNYSVEDGFNRVSLLPGGVSFGVIDFGGQSIVYFLPVSGLPASPGSLTLFSDRGDQATIAVDAFGIITIDNLQ